MDGSVDIKFIITIGGILFSIAGAAAVAKSQIARLTELLKDIEQRMRKADTRTDRIETKMETQLGTAKQRLDVIAKMMDPPTMERRARESERTAVTLEQLDKMISKIESRIDKND
tara:strand:+ start:91 stop:435 length:345 start_codon:yes stop_codon:yes gene_type:complete